LQNYLFSAFDQSERCAMGQANANGKSDLPKPFTPDELRAIVRNVFIGKGVKRC